MSEARIVLTAVDQTRGALASASAGLARMQGEAARLQGALASLAGGVGVGALLALARNAVAAGDEMSTLAKKSGQSVATLSALKFAADQSETSITELAAGLRIMSRNMANSGADFAQIGVATRRTDGSLRDTKDVLLDVAQVFAQMPDGAEKTALALQLFGRNGEALIPFLNQGREGIRGLMEEAQRLGVVMSDEFAQAADEFNDNLAKVRANLGSLLQSAIGPAVEGWSRLIDVAVRLRGGQSLSQALGDVAQQQANAEAVKDLVANVQRIPEATRRAAAGARELGQSFKGANEDAKKGAEATIKAYDNLKNALRGALQEGVERARALRQEAAELLGQADKARDGGKAKAEDLRLSALPAEQQDAARQAAAQQAADEAAFAAATAANAALDGRTQVAEAQARRALDFAQQAEALAGRLEDKGQAADLVERAAEAQAAALEAQARTRQGQAAQAEQQAEQQSKLLADLEEKLDRLRQKAGEIPVSLDISKAEAALDRLAARMAGAIAGGSTPGTWGTDAQGTYWNLDNIPQRAGGGMMRGPGGDTSDNLLAWLSPGEYVVRAAAVRHYGAGLLGAINSLKLPRFADGGAVGTTINLSWPGGGPFPVSASPAVAAEMVALFQREALKRGRRA